MADTSAPPGAEPGETIASRWADWKVNAAAELRRWLGVAAGDYQRIQQSQIHNLGNEIERLKRAFFQQAQQIEQLSMRDRQAEAAPSSAIGLMVQQAAARIDELRNFAPVDAPPEAGCDTFAELEAWWRDRGVGIRSVRSARVIVSARERWIAWTDSGAIQIERRAWWRPGSVWWT